jgi:hypothetical protein
MTVEACSSGGVQLRHVHNRGRTQRIEGVDALVWVGAQRANDPLARALQAAGVPNIRVIGDAFAPRRLPDAIHEGYEAALSVSAEA